MDELSRGIMEQLEDVPKVEITVAPHGVARLFCLMGFHDAYNFDHDDGEECLTLVFCVRCGRSLCLINSSSEDA